MKSILSGDNPFYEAKHKVVDGPDMQAQKRNVRSGASDPAMSDREHAQIRRLSQIAKRDGLPAVNNDPHFGKMKDKPSGFKDGPNGKLKPIPSKKAQAQRAAGERHRHLPPGKKSKAGNYYTSGKVLDYTPDSDKITLHRVRNH